jgi:general L-amino acid transport system substrate-binding protein
MHGRVAIAISLLCCAALAAAGPTRVEKIQKKGFLTCGVAPDVPGFAATDASGRYAGFEIDICRAVATAILGSPDKVRFERAMSVAEFRAGDDIDMVARRLTWELRREAPLGLLFGPITFYDGQGFLVARSTGAHDAADVSRLPICVASNTAFERALTDYFSSHALTLQKRVVPDAEKFDDIANALTAGRCPAYSADVSELGAIRSLLPRPADFEILPDLITKEPLAPLVRADDAQFFEIVRWTVFALIQAEELGVTSANAAAMRTNGNVEARTLLGTERGNGKALGLDEAWAYNVIRALGNYGELFEKNLGRGSPVGLDRGLNRLWKDGGLMYAPPLR